MPSDATILKARLRTWAARVTEDAGRRTTAHMVQHEAPRKTGELAHSGRQRPFRGSYSRFTTGVSFHVIQAATTDKGARPHVIRPHRAPALVFYWPKAGRVVHLRKVNHPGNKPQRWFAPGLRRWWPRDLRAAARARRL